MENKNTNTQVLNDEELENVAGGVNVYDVAGSGSANRAKLNAKKKLNDKQIVKNAKKNMVKGVSMSKRRKDV